MFICIFFKHLKKEKSSNCTSNIPQKHFQQFFWQNFKMAEPQTLTGLAVDAKIV